MTLKLEPWQKAWLGSRDDPWLFVTGVFGVLPYGEPNQDGAVQLEFWQDEALKAIRDGKKRISIRSGHGVGKTTFESWLALWAVLTHSDCKVPIAANSQDQLRDVMWPEIAKWYRRLPEPLQKQVDVQAERIVIKAAPDQAFAVRRTATKENSEALQGFHADFLLFLIDEASGIPDVVFEVAAGALSTPGAVVVMCANPTRASGFFYDTHHKLRDRWHTMRVSSEDVPRARGHIEDVIASYGKGSNKYRVRVMGDFPNADDDTVIPLSAVEAAISRDVAPLEFYPIWGVDVGRFGDDSSALAKRQSNKLLEPVKEWLGLDNVQLANLIKREYDNTPKDLQPSEILIDVIGIGAGVVDVCSRIHKLPARGVNVAESPSTDDKFRRLRDELWWMGREWFLERKCSMPQDDKLISELTAPTYDFDVMGKIVAESKKDMKKRGLRSPNKADAFLLTFAGTPRPRPRVSRGKHRAGSSRSSWVA